MPSLSSLTKYLGLLSIGKGFIDKVVFQKLLRGLAAVVGLSVIGGILFGAIIITLLTILYFVLVQNAGVSNYGALAIDGLITIAILGFIISRIALYTKKIATVLAVITETFIPASPIAPITAPLSDIYHSFLSGLKSKREEQESESNEAQPKYPKSVK